MAVSKSTIKQRALLNFDKYQPQIQRFSASSRTLAVCQVTAIIFLLNNRHQSFTQGLFDRQELEETQELMSRAGKYCAGQEKAVQGWVVHTGKCRVGSSQSKKGLGKARRG